jgi:hypothetical protein
MIFHFVISVTQIFVFPWTCFRSEAFDTFLAGDDNLIPVVAFITHERMLVEAS